MGCCRGQSCEGDKETGVGVEGRCSGSRIGEGIEVKVKKLGEGEEGE